jgi:transcriptional regulator with GAF, ATPase, and Fis domain
VGELPLSVQPKLLRAVEYGELQRVGSLETRKVDVHVIAATNRDLRSASAAGQFRSDLFYRLGIMEVHVPPLRDRRGDIPLLTAAFIRDCAKRMNRPLSGITTAAEQILQESSWDGNIRELRNVVERACLLSESRMLTERDVMGAMKTFHRPLSSVTMSGAAPAERRVDNQDDLLSTVQRSQIDRILKRVGGNKTQAARLLGISRRSLYRWIDRLERVDDGTRAREE